MMEISRNKEREMPQKPYKRRTYFIKKDYQFKFILKFCLIILLGAVVSTGLLFLLSQGSLTSTFENSKLVIRKTSVAILPSMIYTNLVTLALVTVATIAVVLFISHKIAGPMFRLARELKEIQEGDLTKNIRLRKEDQITEMAAGINALSTSFRAKILELESELDRLKEIAEEENASDQVKEGLNRLRDRIHDQFKL